MQLKTYTIAKCDSFDHQACSLLQVINVMTNNIIMIVSLIICAEKKTLVSKVPGAREVSV